VDELGVRSYFTAVVSGAEMPGKPDPAVFLEAARRIGVPPENCLVIEDSVAGVQAALRGGMKCLAVTTTNPGALLKDAHLILDSLELLSWEAVSCIFHNP
jgi:beta-phosphoglucomutase-like phosphatase (HAD superfamily)